MSSDQRNVFFTIVLLIHKEGGAIAHKPKTLARHCNVATRRFNAVLAELLDAKALWLRDGRIGEDRAVDMMGENQGPNTPPNRRGAGAAPRRAGVMLGRLLITPGTTRSRPGPAAAPPRNRGVFCNKVLQKTSRT